MRFCDIEALDAADRDEAHKFIEYMLLVKAAEAAGVPHLEACRHMYETVYGADDIEKRWGSAAIIDDALAATDDDGHRHLADEVVKLQAKCGDVENLLFLEEKRTAKLQAGDDCRDPNCALRVALNELASKLKEAK
jgi:hypothetical protein